jgi:hypothetical protein
MIIIIIICLFTPCDTYKCLALTSHESYLATPTCGRGKQKGYDVTPM